MHINFFTRPIPFISLVPLLLLCLQSSQASQQPGKGDYLFLSSIVFTFLVKRRFYFNKNYKKKDNNNKKFEPNCSLPLIIRPNPNSVGKVITFSLSAQEMELLMLFLVGVIWYFMSQLGFIIPFCILTVQDEFIDREVYLWVYGSTLCKKETQLLSILDFVQPFYH